LLYREGTSSSIGNPSTLALKAVLDIHTQTMVRLILHGEKRKRGKIGLTAMLFFIVRYMLYLV